MAETRSRNYLNLVLGIAFLGYGSWRLYTYITGNQYETFRLIVAVTFVLFGLWDLYFFFKPRLKK
ncbi:hypothetical protein [Salinimicrobium flavum]|uniref:TM2 domain-containing protein n=1 Tax=Salinimicrobium flavum TaxID=1737065 RepID=A0ABW5IU62_9FLAO